MSLAHAIFAAGCFWGVQATFDNVAGVVSTQVGYTGGSLENPTYQQVSTGKTGHAEAVEVFYNPNQISYQKLLDIFFQSHNPTTLNRQGPDIGEQYRSAVFYQSPQQKELIEQTIQNLNESGKYKNPIVTQVLPEQPFYKAEEYHQKYLEKKGLVSCHLPALEEEEEEESEVQSSFSEQDFKKKLSSEQYHVLREKGTEKPFSGKYLNHKADGTYACAACGNPIFSSDAKFDSGSGWPSFDKALPNSVKLSHDFSHNMIRIEVTCAKCGSHLGHLFYDGPTATKARFCINSVALDFEKEK